MRFISLAFLFVLSLNVAAQSPIVSGLFAEGTKLAKQERFADALQSYKGALSIADNEYLDAGYRARLRFNIGVCYFRLQRFDQAVDEFKHALILKSDYATAHDALKIAEVRRRELKSSFASLKASK